MIYLLFKDFNILEITKITYYLMIILVIFMDLDTKEPKNYFVFRIAIPDDLNVLYQLY